MSMVKLFMLALAFGIFVIVSTVVFVGPAYCQSGCENVTCSDELPCPGDCGCVQRQGQPFGVCRTY